MMHQTCSYQSERKSLTLVADMNNLHEASLMLNNNKNDCFFFFVLATVVKESLSDSASLCIKFLLPRELCGNCFSTK